MKKQNFTKKVKNNAQNTKQNQDFPNVPQTPKSEGTSEINKNQINPNSAIEKKEYFSILISNCVAVEKNKR